MKTTDKKWIIDVFIQNQINLDLNKTKTEVFTQTSIRLALKQYNDNIFVALKTFAVLLRRTLTFWASTWHFRLQVVKNNVVIPLTAA